MRIPRPIPTGIRVEQFRRWTTPEAKILWIGETVEMVLNRKVDLLNVVGMLEAHDAGGGIPAGDGEVALYVPRAAMDKVRLFPGVRWNKRLRMYVAGPEADFRVVHPYLTAAAKSVWMTERNLDAGIALLVKSRAMIIMKQVDDNEGLGPIELEPVRSRDVEDDDES